MIQNRHSYYLRVPLSICALIFQEDDLPGVVAADFTIHIVDQAVAIVLAEQLKAAFFNTLHLHRQRAQQLFIYGYLYTCQSEQKTVMQHSLCNEK